MHYHAPNGRIAVHCSLTGEKLNLVVTADTDAGYLDMWVMRDGHIAQDRPMVHLPGRIVIPLKMHRQYRPFVIVDRETGELFAESKVTYPYITTAEDGSEIQVDRPYGNPDSSPG